MSLRTSEARRAGVASTRSKAQCAIEGRKAAGGARTRPKGVRSAGTPRRRRRERCEDTEHRASEAQSGAKTRSDHAELRGGRTASALCTHRRPEGLKWRAHEAKRSAQSKAAKRLEARGHAQRASAAPEHRAAEGESGAKTRNTAQASAQGGAKMRNDHCELRGWQWRGSKLSRHPLVKKTFLTSGFFPALAAVTPDRSRRGRCCPRPGGCPAPGRCGGFPPCGRARGSRRPAFPRALRRRSAG